MKATRLLLAFGLTFLLGVFVVGIYIVPRAEVGTERTTRQSDAGRVPLSDIYVDVTYATPQFIRRVKLEPYLKPYKDRAQPFLIGLNTHVGSIEHLNLRGKVLLEDDHGDQYPALGEPVVVSEHHNMYLLAFPLLDNHGQPIFAANRDHFRLIIRGVGKTKRRVFEWKLPVQEPVPARTVANTLMMALSVIGALMVILSPCAIELTTYYTGIIAGVVSSSALAERGSRLPAPVRNRILRNLAAFVAGFSLLYMTSGATVSLLGEHLMKMSSMESMAQKAEGTAEPTAVAARADSAGTGSATPTAPGRHHRRLFGGWTHYANWLGAAFLIYFALRALGVTRRGTVCFVWLGKLGRWLRERLARLVGLISPARAEIIRCPARSVRQSAANITPINCFCAGLGLSVGCLTCMGGAVLYPLLIFVGTSAWYWGALILGTYSLTLAVPMAAIAVAVGDMTWKHLHRPGLTRALQWTSATVMIAVALLIVFDRTTFINSVLFTVLNAIGSHPQGVGASW